MSVEIKPVSEAAAEFFMSQCLGKLDGKWINSSLVSFLYLHGIECGLLAGNENTFSAVKTAFATFCRAVADQLNPPSVIEQSLRDIKNGNFDQVTIEQFNKELDLLIKDKNKE